MNTYKHTHTNMNAHTNIHAFVRTNIHDIILTTCIANIHTIFIMNTHDLALQLQILVINYACTAVIFTIIPTQYSAISEVGTSWTQTLVIWADFKGHICWFRTIVEQNSSKITSCNRNTLTEIEPIIYYYYILLYIIIVIIIIIIYILLYIHDYFHRGYVHKQIRTYNHVFCMQTEKVPEIKLCKHACNRMYICIILIILYLGCHTWTLRSNELDSDLCIYIILHSWPICSTWRINTYINTCKHTYMHTYIHTHTHIHTWERFDPHFRGPFKMCQRCLHAVFILIHR
jgi:hypothetical protein